VEEQLNGVLPLGWTAVLAARGGARVKDVRKQIVAANLKAATHIVVSVGLNDMLLAVGLLGEQAHTIGDALERLGTYQSLFIRDYTRMLQYVKSRKCVTAVCTIYQGDFASVFDHSGIDVIPSLFNDHIYRLANAKGIPVIELRSIFTKPLHYVKKIEPSSEGGQLLANAIAAHFGAIK
jgi:hypothetical protein